MLLLSSSRKPCARTRTLMKDLNRLIPGSVIINRGKTGVDGLAETARNKGLDRVAIICDRHGNPGEIRFLSVTEDAWDWLPKRIKVKGMKLAREFDGPMPKAKALSGPEDLTKMLSFEPEEGGIDLRVDAGVLSFWKGDEEIGPRLNIEVIE